MEMNFTDKTAVGGIVEQFTELCRHPHPSWGEGPLADYVEALLKEQGLCVIRDEWNNLMADVPATAGRENGPRVVLQGHLDMVCAVKPGSGYHPETSSVTCVVEDGVLRSDGNSSLGADNNLGNAAVLWLLGQDVPHGPLRLLFTVAEEVGLAGATKIDPNWLEGCKYLINTDGFALGRAIVSSAGGLRETFSVPLENTAGQKKCLFSLKFDGFPGGHSGYDIHRNRTNPIVAMARFLSDLGEKTDYELVSLSGGHAYNAIPVDCTAWLAVEEEDIRELKRNVDQLRGKISDGRISLKQEDTALGPVWTRGFRHRVLSALNDLTIGVYAWRDKEKEQVSASANLGCISIKDGVLEVACFIRTARREDQDALAADHIRAMEGFALRSESYPGWPERRDNPLVETMAQVWQELTGREMEITAVHVGLEPSVLGAKNPEMAMVNTGPDIFDAHSLDERAPLEGLALYARLLANTLEKLSK